MQQQRKSVAFEKPKSRNNRLQTTDKTFKRKQTLSKTKTEELSETKFKRENPYESGSALKKFERTVAPDEFKQNVFRSNEDLPFGTEVMRTNREEGQIDEILHQQYKQDNNYQMLLLQVGDKGILDKNGDEIIYDVDFNHFIKKNNEKEA